MEQKPVVIHGPQGSGKTRNAVVLAKHFRLKHIVDNCEPAPPARQLRDDTLYLTQNRPAWADASDRRVLHIDDAMRQAGLQSLIQN